MTSFIDVLRADLALKTKLCASSCARRGDADAKINREDFINCL